VATTEGMTEASATRSAAMPRTRQLRAQAGAFASDRSIDGPPLLLGAARRFETLDAQLTGIPI